MTGPGNENKEVQALLRWGVFLSVCGIIGLGYSLPLLAREHSLFNLLTVAAASYVAGSGFSCVLRANRDKGQR